MATLVLGAVGSAIGGAFGGAILGFSGAAIGGFIGSTVGSVVDSWIVSSLAPAQRIEGARLDTLRITSATEGAVIPRLYGRMRIGGNIIWATDFREETKTTTQGGGKGGGGSKVKTTEYLYYASFAVALCEGPITGIGRVWADGKAMDMTGVTWRWYPGGEVQAARFAPTTWGVQWHPEVDEEIFATWCTLDPPSDEADAQQLITEVAAAHTELEAAWRPLALRFAALCGTTSNP